MNILISGLLGPKDRWLSWISIADVANVIQQAMVDPAYHGVINVVAQHPVQVEQFELALSEAHLKKPTWLTLPGYFFPYLLGEMSELLLESQRIEPAMLKKLGYIYRHTSLAATFAATNSPK